MPCPVTSHDIFCSFICLFSLWFVRHYSPSQARSGIGRSVVSGLKWANEKYERFLQRRFPRFYALYHTFMRGQSEYMFKIITEFLTGQMCYHIGFMIFYKGFRLLFQDGKKVRRIVVCMLSEKTDYQNLHYRDMEKIRQVGQRTEADIYGLYCCCIKLLSFLCVAFRYAGT